jgi:mono/diheme cytochrome c family protein
MENLPAGPGDLTSRVGPDLGIEGHRRSDDWHYAHLYAPDLIVPGTRMPAHRHLFVHGPDGRPVPGPEAAGLVAFLQSIGRDRGGDVWAAWRSRDPEAPPRSAAGAGSEAAARALYARHCEACHGASGDGRGAAAPLLTVAPRDFTAGRFRFRSSETGATDADLFRSITLGGGIGSAMPAFYWLTPQERWSLVRLVRSFARAGEEVPPDPGVAARDAGIAPPADGVPAEAALTVEGKRIWEALDCGTCHGIDGRGLTREAAGAAWTDGDGRPVPHSSDLTDPCALRGGASPGAILRAVIAGTGGPMPSYAGSLATDRERRAIVAYVLALRVAGRKEEGPRDR